MNYDSAGLTIDSSNVKNSLQPLKSRKNQFFQNFQKKFNQPLLTRVSLKWHWIWWHLRHLLYRKNMTSINWCLRKWWILIWHHIFPIEKMADLSSNPVSRWWHSRKEGLFEFSFNFFPKNPFFRDFEVVFGFSLKSIFHTSETQRWYPKRMGLWANIGN